MMPNNRLTVYLSKLITPLLLVIRALHQMINSALIKTLSYWTISISSTLNDPSGNK